MSAEILSFDIDALDDAPVYAWISDGKGRFLYRNKKLLETFFSEEQAASSLYWQHLISIDDQTDLREVWRHATSTQESFSLRIRFAHRVENFWDLSGTPQWKTDGQCSWLFIASSVFRYDLLPQEVLAKHESLKEALRRSFQMLPVYAWYADPDGSLMYMNRRIAAMMGLPEEHPLRQGLEKSLGGPSSHLRFLHEDDRARNIRSWAEDLRELRPHECELRIQKANGEWAWFHVQAAPLFDDAGIVVCWTGIHHEITEEKLAEEEIVRSRLRVEHLSHLKNADHIATLMASQMNTPIRNITRCAISVSAMLANAPSKSHTMEKLLERILSECATAAQAVIDVRQAFNIQGISRTMVSLRSLLAEMLRYIALSFHESESKVRLDIHPGLEISVDSFKMQQVFRVLLARIRFTLVKDLPINELISITADESESDVTVQMKYWGAPLNLKAGDFTPIKDPAVPYDIELAVARALIQSHGGHIHTIQMKNGFSAIQLTVPRVRA